MKLSRGDIILCQFPHSSSEPSKKRPALVVQADYYNSRIRNVLVAAITGNLSNASDAAHVLIDVSTTEGKQAGLNRDSLVSCINLGVIPPRNVDRRIGTLPATLMEAVDSALKTAMALAE